MADMISMRSLAHSNLPSGQKSAIRRFLDRNVPSMSGLGSMRGHATHSAHALRAGGEALIVGGLAGLAHASLKHGLDGDAKGQIPLDGIGGLLLLAGAGYAGGFTESAHDLRNAGSTLLGIAVFRKSAEWVAAKRRAKGLPVGGKIAGEVEEGVYETGMGAEDDDEIVSTAKRLSARR
jgi:hypothetical protein